MLSFARQANCRLRTGISCLALGLLLASISCTPLEGQFASANPMRALWSPEGLQVTFNASPRFRYLLEVSSDGGEIWDAVGSWRNGIDGAMTLRYLTNGAPGSLSYRIVATRAKNTVRGIAPAALNHILLSGQSNILGTSDGDYAPLSTTQPFANVMFNPFIKRRFYSYQGQVYYTEYWASGLRAPYCPISAIYQDPLGGIGWPIRDSDYYRNAQQITSFAPLVEASEPLLCCPVIECPVFETMASTIANTLTSRSGIKYLASVHGYGAAPIEGLNKSTVQDDLHAIDLAKIHPGLRGWATGPYANGMYQVLRARELATAQGWSYKVAALVWVHADGTDDSAYHTKLNQLINDYNTDVPILTGQTDPVLLFTEQNQWEASGRPTAVDQEYWTVHLDSDSSHPNHGLAYVVTPRYPERCPVHYPPEGFRAQGTRYANAIEAVLYQGLDWEPLSPREIRSNGTNVDVVFHVPSGHLQTGTTPNLGPISPTLGFVIRNARNTNIIQSAEILGRNTVRLHCAEPARGLTLTYAREKKGAGDVQRGFLCDSDPPPSFYHTAAGADLDTRNFCIAFAAPIPWISLPMTATRAMAASLVSQDADDDRLPDDWERRVFGDLTTAGPGTDRDGDGVSDFLEYQQGTDPLDTGSWLLITQHSAGPLPGQFTISWVPTPSAIYAVEWSADLRNWHPYLGTVITASPNPTATLDLAAEGQPARLFLRVTAKTR